MSVAIVAEALPQQLQRRHPAVATVASPFRGGNAATVTRDLVPMPGFLWVGGYGGRGYAFALCAVWLGWMA